MAWLWIREVDRPDSAAAWPGLYAAAQRAAKEAVTTTGKSSRPLFSVAAAQRAAKEAVTTTGKSSRPLFSVNGKKLASPFLRPRPLFSVCKMGEKNGWHWHERYHAQYDETVKPDGLRGYCDYAAILVGDVLGNLPAFT